MLFRSVLNAPPTARKRGLGQRHGGVYGGRKRWDAAWTSGVTISAEVARELSRVAPSDDAVITGNKGRSLPLKVHLLGQRPKLNVDLPIRPRSQFQTLNQPG